MSEKAASPEKSTSPGYDPGITQRYTGVLDRIVEPDGRFNVKRVGRTWHDANPYIYLISTSWKMFAFWVIMTFILLNICFAGTYILIGPEHIKGAGSSNPTTLFSNLFFFSTHTLTTVGYGNMYPDGPLANLVASVEALTGLMTFAIATGLLFGRFSRPNARFSFSDTMIVAPYGTGTSLQLRLANRRTNNLIEVEGHVIWTTVELQDGNPIRKYRMLDMERTEVLFLALTWTLVHPITETSPLYGKTQSDLTESRAEAIVMIKAYDETFGQTVYVRHSYRYDEIVWGARFAPAFDTDAEGELLLSVNKVGATQSATLPPFSGSKQDSDLEPVTGDLGVEPS